MARADILKRMIKSHLEADESEFREAVLDAISDEKRKRHYLLARELMGLLTPKNLSSEGIPSPLYPLPADNDCGIPLLAVKNPDRYFRDLILDKTTESLLSRAVSEFHSWDILATHGLSPSSRLLFCGPPGCGKTAAAEALSSETGLPLLYVKFDGVVSSLLGETATNLSKVFDYAKHGSWILFFDEFDAIGRSRDDPTEHGEIKRVVNSFLQLLDNFRGQSLVIAATNFEQSIDHAIWRRFDEVVHFPLPNTLDCRHFINMQLTSFSIQAKSLETLVESTKGASYADLERLCADMKKSCILRGDKKIRKQLVEEALSRFSHRKSILSNARRLPPSIDSM